MVIKENLTHRITKYAKVRIDKDNFTEELRPNLLCEYGDHEFLDRILSPVGTIEFFVDEGYPSYWITLKSKDEFIQVDQRDKFGFVDKTSQEALEDCILIFTESHFKLLHFFVIEGAFQDTSGLFDSFKNNELNDAIALLLGQDQDVLCEVQHAILEEREAERIGKFQLFNHYLKIAPISSGPNFYINGLDANGDGFMGQFYGSDGFEFSYEKAYPHSRDYTLVLSNHTTTCRFSMKEVYGILSHVESNGGYKGTVLVYHNLTENSFEFFSTRDMINESPQDLLDLFAGGALNMEVDRIIPSKGSKRFFTCSDQYFQLLEKVRKSDSNTTMK